MNRSRIHAVEDVNMEAPFGIADDLRWFYGELVQLEEVAAPGNDAIVFRSGPLHLRIRFVPSPDIDAVRCRLTLLVYDLSAAAERLDERSVWHIRVQGIVWSDVRLETFDPAGNRVHLKRDWPEIKL